MLTVGNPQACRRSRVSLWCPLREGDLCSGEAVTHELRLQLQESLLNRRRASGLSKFTVNEDASPEDSEVHLDLKNMVFILFEFLLAGF